MPREGRLEPLIIRTGTVVVLGTVMSILDMTIVAVALRTLSHDFHVNINTIQWVTTGFLLSLAIVCVAIPLVRLVALPAARRLVTGAPHRPAAQRCGPARQPPPLPAVRSPPPRGRQAGPAPAAGGHCQSPAPHPGGDSARRRPRPRR